MTATGAGAAPAVLYTFTGDSSITYHVRHPLHHIDGTTHQLAGQLKVVPGDEPQLALPLTLSSPILSFRSGNRNRDHNVLGLLDIGRFPDATVVIAMVEWAKKGTTAPPGEWNGTGKGTLTLHGQTRPVAIALSGLLAQDEVRVTGHLRFLLSDFGIERPKLLFQPIDDEVLVDVQGLARKD